MLSVIAVSALAAVAQALVARDGTCCFHLTGNGQVGGVVGQLSDGQNRVGQSDLPTGQYCIDSNGGLTDANGRGCILTPPTTQLQCDTGATPTPGFSVGCDGTLAYNGDTSFFACQTGSDGENIYKSTDSSETGCTPLTLTADGCKANCAPPPPSGCPADLNGAYEFPHLIVPVSSANPNTAYGTQYNGQITPNDISSIFNFDIPAADAGKTCSLIFLFPTQAQLQTSSFTISGDGVVDFSSLSGVATTSTTFANQPGVASDLGTKTVAPGNSYLISTFGCPAGTTQSYKLSSASTSLTYFQDYNPSPIGLYIRVC